MSWWRRRASEAVVDAPDERELVRVAEREAVARRRAQAEQALRDELSTPSGQCVVDALVAPWLLRQRQSWHDAGSLPPADVLLAAFRLLGEDLPPAVVEEFVAGEPVEQRAAVTPPPPEDERLRFAEERPGHAAGWRMPEGLDLAAHSVAARRLHALHDIAFRADGTGLPVDEVLGNPRWWPGRSAQPPALADLFSQLFRREEAAGVDPTWLQASRDAQDLLYRAADLPAVSPEAWVLAATDHTVRGLR